MSTRSHVIVKDQWDTIWFYRHSDGYPSGAGERLKPFLRWLIDGKIRDNAGQAAGWLVLLGAVEYQTMREGLFSFQGKESWDRDYDGIEKALAEMFDDKGDGMMDWKCGAYEPCTCCHGDIEYVYIVDVENKQITCHRPGQEDVEGKGYSDSVFDVENPTEPFLVIDADNIDAHVDELIPEEAQH